MCNIRLKQLKYLEQTLATYVYSHYKHMQHPDLLLQHPHETCNMHMKHLAHMLATFEEERERRVQPEKPALGLATPDLVMSRAKVERRGGAGVDSGQDLPVGNDDVGSTSTRRGTGHGVQGRGPGTA
jgi:hypothetical protein